LRGSLKSSLDYKSLSIEETLKALDASLNGLSEEEARKRIEKYGYNEVREEKRNPIVEFLSRYWGPMPWLLELAIVLSIFLSHIIEAIIIFVLLTINVTIGFMHSRHAQKALEYLKKRLAVKVKVLRDGKWALKDAREIVPGDIILIGLGDLMPADAKIVGGELSVDQSSLTGESLPVSLKPLDIVYAGSVVIRGEAKCIVINTGANTYFGRTAELVKIAKPKSHQEELVLNVTRYMLYLGAGALTVTAVFAFFAGIDFLTIVTFAVILLMSAVPVALPAVLTIVQAAGAMELAREGALVTRLSAVEDAASVDVLCLDKTGTITQNKLAVVSVIPISGFKEEEVVLTAALASSEEGKDPIDLAVINYAKLHKSVLENYKITSFTPFDPNIKRAEAIVESNGARFKVVKGAPQIIMGLCKVGEAVKAEAEKVLEEMSRRGYRVLAVARSSSNDIDDFMLIGFLALADPVRSDSKALIEEIRKLGIRPLMITGDNIVIAKEVAKQVGLRDRILPANEFKHMMSEEVVEALEDVDGLAEVYPEDKYHVVKSLQMRGRMVGMTGDGVNDAPALKQAELGIAVSNAADVAKAAASVVLTEPGLKQIVTTVRISRVTYQRMLTWVINKITKTIQSIALLVIGFFWLRQLILSLLDMTLLVFANDFATMSIATDNATYTPYPNKWNIKMMTLASLATGAFMIIGGLISIWVGVSHFHLYGRKLQVFTMLMLVFSSQFRILIVRERRHFWSSRPGKALILSIMGIMIAFVVLGIYGIIIPALSLHEVFFTFGFSGIWMLALVDPIKHLIFAKMKV
jgi:H+-transporting ATPase